jgi:hypothetical protein
MGDFMLGVGVGNRGAGNVVRNSAGSTRTQFPVKKPVRRRIHTIKTAVEKRRVLFKRCIALGVTTATVKSDGNPRFHCKANGKFISDIDIEMKGGNCVSCYVSIGLLSLFYYLYPNPKK